MIKVGIVTVSDKGSRGEREDTSSLTIRELVRGIEGEVLEYRIVPDEQPLIEHALMDMIDNLGIQLILTTGGTGFSPRDVTPEATLAVVQRIVPGIPEAMRWESSKVTPRAMLSRAAAGIRKQCLIVNLPGSPKGVRECLGVILLQLPHAIEILTGVGGECGGK
jgi:molybdopterin adenylyltransferase